MRSSVRSVPFVPTTTVAPRCDAYAAMCVRSCRSSGSPPDRINIGLGLTAISSSTIRKQSAVSSSVVALSRGPAAM